MLKAIVIDDEPLALEVIKGLTDKVTFVELAGYFTNSFQAMEFLQANKVDLLFLDIKMPDISGIEFLKSIPDPPMVIFTTAYSEHAVEGFELDAIDYLLKPFSLTRFLKACNKAYEHYELKRNKNNNSSSGLSHVFIKSGYEQIRVELDGIRYAEGSGNYVMLVLEKQKITSRLTMSETEALLPATDFIRVHRSYIVSKKHIQKIDKRTIWIHQTEIPIGSAYASEIEKIIR
jgi:DNA-binding LytR/AlgR family response regulator